jgi:hypothetical protein
VEKNDRNALERLLAVTKTVVRDVMSVPGMWKKCVCAEGTDSEQYCNIFDQHIAKQWLSKQPKQ